MMGRTHALTGAAAGAGIAACYPHLLPAPLWTRALTLIAGTALTAGAALLPDIDHHSSTVTRVYGPLTASFGWLVNLIMGGHRRGTHSLLGVALMAALAEAGACWRHTPWGLLLAWPMILALAGLVRLFHIPGWFDDVAPIPVVLALVYLTPVPLWYVPLVLALGALVHIGGDMITAEGCPLLWPLPGCYGPGLIRTGGFTERWLIVPGSMIAITYAGWITIGGTPL
jgi:membrane-bound metal-dependent hydrolase YbcI (DUF457 family)